MGCISSKVIARSISYHEERKQGSRTTNAIPLLEDLIISAKLHSRSFGSNSSRKLAIDLINSETIDKLEVPTTLGQERGKQIESDNNKKSKSWHAFSEHILSSLDQENSLSFEDEHNLSSKGYVGSRSFHTLEEYNELVNRIWLSKSVEESELNDKDDDDVDEFVSNATHHTEEDDKDSASKKIQPTCLQNQCSSEESKNSAQESTIVTPDSYISISGMKNEELGTNQKTSTTEKGNKRKALAKRLGSLKIPANVELPAIASLREWVPASGIYSPGTYITPKFGSYSSNMNIRSEKESSDDSIFSPELVSAFEQCMQKLEADEETFLKQIIENVEEESDEAMQPLERTPTIEGLSK